MCELVTCVLPCSQPMQTPSEISLLVILQQANIDGSLKRLGLEGQNLRRPNLEGWHLEEWNLEGKSLEG